MIGLVLTGIGHGGIRPCINAFGGDQFKLPEQEKHLTTFFTIWYISTNAGCLAAILIAPTIRFVYLKRLKGGNLRPQNLT